MPEDTEFYLIKIQAFRIGQSEPAPQFTIVTGPSTERKAGGEVKRDFAEQDKRRYEFFESPHYRVLVHFNITSDKICPVSRSRGEFREMRYQENVDESY